MSDTFGEVKAIIIDILGITNEPTSKIKPEQVTLEASFREDLETDSLDLVDLIMQFEDHFGSVISDEDAQKIITVGDAVKYIDEHPRTK